MFCTQFRTDACVPISAELFFAPALIHIPKSWVACALAQRNNYKCQEHCDDDESHPIVNLNDSFCFFFIHTSVSSRNMVMPSVDAAKVQIGCYRRVARVIKNYCNLTMS